MIRIIVMDGARLCPSRFLNTTRTDKHERNLKLSVIKKSVDIEGPSWYYVQALEKRSAAHEKQSEPQETQGGERG
ncbi:MAG: hypothetical protein RSG50_06920, partial [Clostridia bacterium]